MAAEAAPRPVRRAFVWLMVATGLCLAELVITLIVLSNLNDLAGPYRGSGNDFVDGLYSALYFTLVLAIVGALLGVGLLVAFRRRVRAVRIVALWVAVLTGLLWVTSFAAGPETLDTKHMDKATIEAMNPLWYVGLRPLGVVALVVCSIAIGVLVTRSEAVDYYHYDEGQTGLTASL
jgi:hypothetical protein